MPENMGPAAGPGATAAVYEIKVRGHLPDYRAAWFDGMTVARDEEGNTTLRGLLADQAALHGVLDRVRDLGLLLLSVARVPPEVLR